MTDREKREAELERMAPLDAAMAREAMRQEAARLGVTEELEGWQPTQPWSSKPFAVEALTAEGLEQGELEAEIAAERQAERDAAILRAYEAEELEQRRAAHELAANPGRIADMLEEQGHLEASRQVRRVIGELEARRAGLWVGVCESCGISVARPADHLAGCPLMYRTAVLEG